MKCKKILDNNQQCDAFALKDKDFCFMHDPELKEARLIASSRGGQNRVLQGNFGKEVRINSPSHAKKFISEVINKVWTGQVPAQIGSSMGFLVRVWLECHEASDIVKRLDEIEEKLTSLNQPVSG